MIIVDLEIMNYRKKLYEKYVEEEGKEAADRESARPGYSEHQTRTSI